MSIPATPPGTSRSGPVRCLVGLTLALVVLSLAAAGLYAVRADQVGTFAFRFLVKNLLLAWVPFGLALGVAAVHCRRGSRLLLGVLAAGWLVFLPNAPYIVTDVVHLRPRTGVPLWFDVAVFGTFATAGFALGLASLLVVHQVVEARAGRASGWAVAIGSLVLSAVGIYLGRVLRFNSWNVVTDPQRLVLVASRRLADPLGNLFLLQFGLAMSAVLVTSYVMTWVLAGALLKPVRGLSTHV